MMTFSKTVLKRLVAAQMMGSASAERRMVLA
jgi:hypothetical protein